MTPPLTAAERAALRELEAKTTPGEWYARQARAWAPVAVLDAKQTELLVGPYERAAETVLVCAARNALVPLLDALDEAERGRLGADSRCRSAENALDDERDRVIAADARVKELEARCRLFDHDSILEREAEVARLKAENEQLAEVARRYDVWRSLSKDSDLEDADFAIEQADRIAVLQSAHDGLSKDVVHMVAENARLRAALAKYGRHLPECTKEKLAARTRVSHPADPCTCGLDSARSESGEREREPDDDSREVCHHGVLATRECADCDEMLKGHLIPRDPAPVPAAAVEALEAAEHSLHLASFGDDENQHDADRAYDKVRAALASLRAGETGEGER